MTRPDTPFSGECPWCGLGLDVGIKTASTPLRRRCACGAVAFGAPRGDEAKIIDAMIAYYQISPSAELRGKRGDWGWLKDFFIEAQEGGWSDEADRASPVRWRWFKRSLPWEPPAGPMTDEERLAWLKSQGEKFYDMMYDSRNPGHEYRETKEFFEEAVSLARRMGREAEAAELEKRFEHIKAVFRSQFNF